jgi:hypothetical protein
MDLLKLIAMSPVVRIHPTTGPWWDRKAKQLERKQYHQPLASLLEKVVARWDNSCREDVSRCRLVAEVVETNGGELKVNATGANVLFLPAEQALVEASVEEAGGGQWKKQVHLGPLMAKFHGISGFKRSREQILRAVGTHRKKLRR